MGAAKPRDDEHARAAGQAAGSGQAKGNKGVRGGVTARTMGASKPMAGKWVRETGHAGGCSETREKGLSDGRGGEEWPRHGVKLLAGNTSPQIHKCNHHLEWSYRPLKSDGVTGAQKDV